MNNYIAQHKIVMELEQSATAEASKIRGLTVWEAGNVTEMTLEVLQFPLKVEVNERKRPDGRVFQDLDIYYSHYSNGQEVKSRVATMTQEEFSDWNCDKLANLVDQGLQAYDGLANNTYKQAIEAKIGDLEFYLSEDDNADEQLTKTTEAQLEILDEIVDNRERLSDKKRGLI